MLAWPNCGRDAAPSPFCQLSLVLLCSGHTEAGHKFHAPIPNIKYKKHFASTFKRFYFNLPKRDLNIGKWFLNQETWIMGSLGMGLMVSPSFSFKEEKGFPSPLLCKEKQIASLFMRATHSPQMPPTPSSLLVHQGDETSFQGPRQGPAVPCVPKVNVPTYRAQGRKQDCQPSVQGRWICPRRLCAESHWHFKLAGHWFVFCLDRMRLHEGLWITVIPWNCQTSWSGQRRGRSEWIIVLYYFWRKAVLRLSRRYSNGNQVWPGEILGERLQGLAKNEL